MYADQLPAERRQDAAAAHLRWLQQQPLLARLFTSKQQEDSIRELTQQPTAAADDAPNGAEVDMQAADGDSSAAAAAAADVLTLKQDMLRVEALMVDALQVRDVAIVAAHAGAKGREVLHQDCWRGCLLGYRIVDGMCVPNEGSCSVLEGVVPSALSDSALGTKAKMYICGPPTNLCKCDVLLLSAGSRRLQAPAVGAVSSSGR